MCLNLVHMHISVKYEGSMTSQIGTIGGHKNENGCHLEIYVILTKYFCAFSRGIHACVCKL